ncbi:HD family phosphohydrolase [Amycolatopsis sp. CA-126428]|uniref:HD family phosphohydrolase n=1 Tax=Amycolatopsis sp. CA-126428 TaxID=2073158 RepID=UPI000CCFEB60|nr:HD family phosphohydrolase [Amycolatopsis sp. CA-126428]
MRTQESTIDHVIVDAIGNRVHRLCREYADRLPFHGWHHVNFVRTKAAGFARHNGADAAVVEVAALVHDVNYLVLRNSPAAAGRSLRREILAECGVPAWIARWIDEIVDEAEMATRGRDISLEAQALSDADTLFKALPVTPVVLAHRYLRENGLSLRELADKIVGEQCDVHDEGYYFYNPEAAATYSRWATANLQLWRCIKEAVDDPTVAELLAAVAS